MLKHIGQWLKKLWMNPWKIFRIFGKRGKKIYALALPEAKVLSNGSTKTKMYLNDPTTPNLMIERDLPKPILSINAVGDQGGGFPFGSIQQQAAACRGIVGHALAYMASKTPRSIHRWAATNTLTILPRAGKDINAYYDRGALRFFYFGDKELKKNIYACDSRPVVAHEFGHAYLDILRPDFWSAQALEVWAFHEAFGDMTALLDAIQYDELVDEAIKETNGDLMKSNVITRLAAEMGIGLFHITKGKDGSPQNCLRDMSIVYKYVSPEKLPNSGPDNQIINECHSFSRIFTGAFYECLVKMSILETKDGKSQKDALKIAGDALAVLLLNATVGIPATVRLFDAAARQMMVCDKANGGKYQDILQEVFSNRGILRPVIKILDTVDFQEIRRKITDEAYELQLHGDFRVLRTYSTKKMKLADVLDGDVVAQDNNPLLHLEIEIPNQIAYYFDENNQLADVVEADREEIIDSAYKCLDYLNKNDLVGTHKEALFHNERGKLVRKQIVCKCGKPNYCDPNAPEYGKPWKPKNNAGCVACHTNCEPRSCDCPDTTPSPPPKLGCYTSMKAGSVKSYKVGQFISRKVC